MADKLDTITVDVPLFIRLLELAREDLKSDADLHHVVTRVLAVSKQKDVLTMDDYEAIQLPSHPADQESQVELEEEPACLARLKEHAATVDYTVKRIAQTVVPGAQTGVPAYTSNICHAQVAKAILKRGKVSDKIHLFGSEAGDVIHSLLTDENNKVVMDAWHSSTSKFIPDRGYEKRGEFIPTLDIVEVSQLFEDYQ